MWAATLKTWVEGILLKESSFDNKAGRQKNPSFPVPDRFDPPQKHCACQKGSVLIDNILMDQTI